MTTELNKAGNDTDLSPLPSHLIVFDGVCNLCNGAVRFILRYDKAGLFHFTPMQSDYAQTLLTQLDKNADNLDTFILLQHGHCYERSDAALIIAQQLSGPWPIFVLFKWVPKKLRDAVYNLIAQHRYRLFGKTDQCQVPSAELEKRFFNNEKN